LNEKVTTTNIQQQIAGHVQHTRWCC